METIDRIFRPGFWRLSLPFLIVSMLVLFLSAQVSTAFEMDYPWVADAVGIVFGGYFIAAPFLFVVLILSRLRLHSDGFSLDASILICGLCVLRRSAKGSSWHAVATPGRSQMEFEGDGRYRVEVTTGEGERISLLGPVMCWFFRVECL